MSYSHEKIPEVLEAYKLLLNDSMALDYCGITGKDRMLILNDSAFSREAKKIKAERYIEEIKDINDMIKSITRKGTDDNARISEDTEDPTKLITLKMKATSMRREMLSLSSEDTENEETQSLNIFFIDVTREEFERLQNVEIHVGDENAKLVTDENKDAPVMTAEKRKKIDKAKTSVPKELSVNTIEYTDSNGEKVIEEV